MSRLSEPTEVMTIGTINLGEFDIRENTLDTVHFGKGLGDCKIQVFNNEGIIPHFHITSKGENFECCVCIFEPLYFNHGRKNGKLDANQRKQLNKWLCSPSNAVVGNLTNWENIVLSWQNLGNSMKCIPKVIKQPDYINMENMRS